MHENFDLFVLQHAARAFCKGRHERARNPVRGGAADLVVAGDGQIDGIRQRERRVAFAVLAVAAGAVLDCRASRSRALASGSIGMSAAVGLPGRLAAGTSSSDGEGEQ